MRRIIKMAVLKYDNLTVKRTIQNNLTLCYTCKLILRLYYKNTTKIQTFGIGSTLMSSSKSSMSYSLSLKV